MILTSDDYKRLRDFIYRKTGLFFEDKKLYFMEKRIKSRIEITKCESPIEYLKMLQFYDTNGNELQSFLNVLTTNETYFFREFEQLASFAEHCLPEICERKKALSNFRLRIWSAGCSTGEEPYTLAIILREMLDNVDEWLIEIIGTDINTKVLNFAKNAVYESRAIKDVPPEYLNRWFLKSTNSIGSETFRVHPTIRSMCNFEQLNLSDKVRMRLFRNVDFIFCRNVLIYFDEDSRKQVVGNLYDSLNPEGYIFLGHSESMSRISSAFKIRRKGGFIVYQKTEY
ncbi:MAG: protein-glutamate O-methyltransferase CheR [Desulfobacterales bacterium]|nr:protein-glutamate O-methyltransferase CheR [Desulfobacterales bacterium]